jgi:antitoxin VapB
MSDMTLNIKDPETQELARKIAEQTGETITRAITEALRERLFSLNKSRDFEDTAEKLLAIGRRCVATLKRRPVDHGFLYDEHGLPKSMHRSRS